MNCWFDVPLLSDGEARLEHDSVFGWMDYPEDFQTRDDYFRDGLALIRTVTNQTEKLQKVVADYLHFAKDPALCLELETFLQSLPVYLADEFLQLGAAGDDLAIQRFGADEKVSEIAEEACAHVFYWNNPKASEDFFEYARAHDGGRTWVFPLLDSLWTQYQTRSAINHLNPSEPTAEEILADAENMTDEELAATLTEARRLRSNGEAR